MTIYTKIEPGEIDSVRRTVLKVASYCSNLKISVAIVKEINRNFLLSLDDSDFTVREINHQIANLRTLFPEFPRLKKSNVGRLEMKEDEAHQKLKTIESDLKKIKVGHMRELKKGKKKRKKTRKSRKTSVSKVKVKGKGRKKIKAKKGRVKSRKKGKRK